MGVNLSNLYSESDLRAHEASRSVSASLFSLEKLPDQLFAPCDPNCYTSGPFEQLFGVLAEALFDPQWTRRHGATVGLRELLRNRSATLGLPSASPAAASADCASTSDAQTHLLLLEELACRLVLLVSLDKFGDFTSDRVRYSSLFAVTPSNRTRTRMRVDRLCAALAGDCAGAPVGRAGAQCALRAPVRLRAPRGLLVWRAVRAAARAARAPGGRSLLGVGVGVRLGDDSRRTARPPARAPSPASARAVCSTVLVQCRLHIEELACTRSTLRTCKCFVQSSVPSSIVESLIESLVRRLLVQPHAAPLRAANTARPDAGDGAAAGADAKQSGHYCDDVLTLAASTFSLLVDLPAFALPADTSVRDSSIALFFSTVRSLFSDPHTRLAHRIYVWHLAISLRFRRALQCYWCISPPLCQTHPPTTIRCLFGGSRCY